MKVREIEFGDLFLASKLIRKIDLKGMIKEIGVENVAGLSDEEKETLVTEKSIDVLMFLLDKVDSSEQEILKLLGAWCEIPPEDVLRLKLSELEDFVNQFIQVNGQERILSFFKRAASMITEQKKLT